MTGFGFLLPWLREVADAFHIPYNAGQVIQIVAFARRTFFKVMFVDMSAIVANRIRNIERKIEIGRASCRERV